MFGSVARQQMGSQHPVVLAGTDQPTRSASPALVHSQAGSGPLLPLGDWRALMLSKAACDWCLLPAVRSWLHVASFS